MTLNECRVVEDKRTALCLTECARSRRCVRLLCHCKAVGPSSTRPALTSVGGLPSDFDVPLEGDLNHLLDPLNALGYRTVDILLAERLRGCGEHCDLLNARLNRVFQTLK